MVYSINCDIETSEVQSGRLAAILAALLSFLRLLPLFFYGRPRTPLRVLCLMAFDTVHVLRKSRRMSSRKIQELASLLDFGACANDFFDKNDFSRQEYRETRRLLERTQSGAKVNEYTSRLRHLENRRPSTGGDDEQHRKAQTYRESVIRLSLGKVAATALDKLTIEDGLQATYCDQDLETLYRIVMLCQIIDDVLDYTKDKAYGLPSFLTAHASPYQALRLTSDAALLYANQSSLRFSPHLFPFRVALLGVFFLTKMVIIYGHLRLNLHAICNRSALIAD